MASRTTGKVWVLDTQTKGTGANMVPLERTLKRGSESVPGFVLPELQTPPAPSPEPNKPYRFRVVDLMTREALADDVDAREAVAALVPVRSIVDVSVYVWDEEAERWRRLTFDETKSLWDYRDGLRTAADSAEVRQVSNN
jgi:hypothetical protein